MLPEISSAIIISIPSVVMFCQLVEDCGRAKAIIIAASANNLIIINPCRKISLTDIYDALLERTKRLDEVFKLRDRARIIITKASDKSLLRPDVVSDWLKQKENEKKQDEEKKQEEQEEEEEEEKEKKQKEKEMEEEEQKEEEEEKNEKV